MNSIKSPKTHRLVVHRSIDSSLCGFVSSSFEVCTGFGDVVRAEQAVLVVEEESASQNREDGAGRLGTERRGRREVGAG